MSRPKRFTVFRDVTSYVGGWALIAYQVLEVPPRDVNEWFLLLAGSLIGVPGVAEIISLRGKEDGIGTGMQGSSSPPQASPSPESSSSSTT